MMVLNRNSFFSKISAWQNGGSPVFVSGVQPSEWISGFGCIPDWTLCQSSDYTMMYRAGSVRENCSITGITVNVYGTTTNAHWDFKLFRWSVVDSAYKCIASIPFTPAGNGTVNNVQTFTFATPVSAMEGDIPGIRTPILCRLVNGTNLTHPPSTGRDNPKTGAVAGDVPLNATALFTDTITTLFPGGGRSDYSYPNMLCLSHRPYAVFLGDSIVSSGNHSYPTLVAGEKWTTDQENQAEYHTPGGSPGNINFSVPYRLSTRMPANFTYQMFSQSGSQFSDMVGLQSIRAVATNPKIAIIHGGINDIIVGAKNWAQISGNLDTLRGQLAGITVYLTEVLPYTNGSDAVAASIRSLNTNYAAYCTTYGWKFVPCHDEMGVIRVSTGLLDDLNPAYTCEGLHLQLVGVDKFAEIISRYIQ
jgi:hypothetical protein